LNLGLNIAATDVYRIRRVIFAAQPNSASLANPPLLGDAFLSVFKGSPGANANNPALIAMKLNRLYPPNYYSGGPRDGGTNPASLYWTLDTPYDILGTDGNPTGAAYTPFFEINLFAAVLNDGTSPVVPGGWMQVDYFQGANQ
jgi:hypothetical protein